VRFLHAQGINMFVPEEGPPAALLARLRQAGLASLPVCRGYVDEAFAIDDAAFLVKGWLADPEGRHTLGWVGAVDDQGNVLGTSRALTQRQDVAAALHMAQPAVGFETGFRLLPPARFGVLTAAVRIVGLDPGGKPPLCTLSQPVMIGPVHVSPIETMGALSPLAGSAASAIGFAPDSTTRLPFQGPAWSAAATRDIDATLRFGLHEAAGADHAVIVPFKGGEGAAAGEVAFRMGDGSLLRQSIGWPWDRPAWRAAVLPPEVVQAHRGVQDVTVTVRPGMIVMVGAPLEAVLRPGWSRLF
jgi:hypothetical protein